MKFIPTHNDWINEISDNLKLVISPDINEEANSNLYTFGISDFDDKPEAIFLFIKECLKVYELKSFKTRMNFYCWYDEMANQLRISSVSTSHGKLPFQCKIKTCSLQKLTSEMVQGNSGLYSDKQQLYVWEKII